MIGTHEQPICIINVDEEIIPAEDPSKDDNEVIFVPQEAKNVNPFFLSTVSLNHCLFKFPIDDP